MAKTIAKPLDKYSKSNMFLGLNWKDMLFAMVMISISAATWIPLLINNEFIAGIAIIIIWFLIICGLLFKTADLRIYVMIYNSIRFVFTKTKSVKLDFVDKIEKNKIYLKDKNNSVVEFYRIVGNDISLFSEEKLEYLSSNLGFFFKENPDANLIKIDGTVELQQNYDFLRLLRSENENVRNEIEKAKETIIEMSENFYNSTQSKYFIKFVVGKQTEESIAENISLLSSAGLELEPATRNEMKDLAKMVFFDKTKVTEHSRYLVIDDLTEADYRNHKPTEEDFGEVFGEVFKINDDFYFWDSDKKAFLKHNKGFENETEQWITVEDATEFGLIEKLANERILERAGELKEEVGATRYVSLISISGFPEIVGPAWLENVFNTQGVDVNFRLVDGGKDHKNLEKTLQKVIVGCDLEIEKLNGQPIKQTKVIEEMQGYQDLVQALADGEEIRRVSVLLKFEADNVKDLKSSIRLICKKLLREKYVFNRMSFKQFDVLKEFFPNETKGIKQEYMEILDDVLGYGFPFTQQEIIDKEGLLFGTDMNQTPVILDFKKRDETKNSDSGVIFGRTGAGKSTTVKRIIKNQIMAGDYKVYVLDPENEYGKLIESFGGSNINVNEGVNIINPFDLNLKEGITEAEYNEALRDKTLFLSGFFKILFEEKLSQGEIDWLLQQTVNLLKHYNVTYEFTFSDLYNYVNSLRDKRTNVVEQLSYYCNSTGGAFGHIWDAQSNIDVNNDYLCFGFRDLLSKSGTSKIGFAQLYLTLQFLNTIVLSNGIDGERPEGTKSVSIILDEAHLLMDPKYLQVVQFVVEMFKRVRKYHGMINIATQNVSDLDKPEIKQYTNNLLNNAFYVYLHFLKEFEIPIVHELLKGSGGLQDYEREFLKQKGFGKCLLMFNENRTIVNVHR